MADIDASNDATDYTSIPSEAYARTSDEADTVKESSSTKAHLVDTPGGLSFKNAVAAMSRSIATESMLYDGASSITTPDDDEVEVQEDSETEESKETEESDESHAEHGDFVDPSDSDSSSSEDTGSGSQGGSHSGASSQQSSNLHVEAKKTSASKNSQASSLSSDHSHSSTDTSDQAVSSFKIFTGHKLRISDSFSDEISIEMASFKHNQVESDYQNHRKLIMISAREHSQNVATYLANVHGYTLHITQGTASFDSDLIPNTYTPAYKTFLKSSEARLDTISTLSYKKSDLENSMTSTSKNIEAVDHVTSVMSGVYLKEKSAYEGVLDKTSAIDSSYDTMLTGLRQISDSLVNLINQLKSGDVSSSKISNWTEFKTSFSTAIQTAIGYATDIKTQNNLIKSLNSKLNTAINNMSKNTNPTQDKINQFNSLKRSINHQLDEARLKKSQDSKSLLSSLDGFSQKSTNLTTLWNTLDRTTKHTCQQNYVSVRSGISSLTQVSRSCKDDIEQTKNSLNTFYSKMRVQLESASSSLSADAANNTYARSAYQLVKDNLSTAKTFTDAVTNKQAIDLNQYATIAKQWYQSGNSNLQSSPYEQILGKLHKEMGEITHQLQNTLTTYNQLVDNTPSFSGQKYTGKETSYGCALDELDHVNSLVNAINFQSENEKALSRRTHKGPVKINPGVASCWWNSYQNYLADVKTSKKELTATIIAMAALVTAAAASSFFTFGLADVALAASIATDAALIITTKNKIKSDQKKAQGAKSAYLSYVNELTVAQATQTKVWRDRVTSVQQKFSHELTTENIKIEKDRKKSEKDLKHNSENMEKIMQMIIRIAKKSKDEHTQSYME